MRRGGRLWAGSRTADDARRDAGGPSDKRRRRRRRTKNAKRRVSTCSAEMFGRDVARPHGEKKTEPPPSSGGPLVSATI